jgi:hypothetical protein
MTTAAKKNPVECTIDTATELIRNKKIGRRNTEVKADPPSIIIPVGA